MEIKEIDIGILPSHIPLLPFPECETPDLLWMQSGLRQAAKKCQRLRVPLAPWSWLRGAGCALQPGDSCAVCALSPHKVFSHQVTSFSSTSMHQAITLFSHLSMGFFCSSFVENQFNTVLFSLNEKTCEIFV